MFQVKLFILRGTFFTHITKIIIFMKWTAPPPHKVTFWKFHKNKKKKLKHSLSMIKFMVSLLYDVLVALKRADWIFRCENRFSLTTQMGPPHKSACMSWSGNPTGEQCWYNIQDVAGKEQKSSQEEAGETQESPPEPCQETKKSYR